MFNINFLIFFSNLYKYIKNNKFYSFYKKKLKMKLFFNIILIFLLIQSITSLIIKYKVKNNNLAVARISKTGKFLLFFISTTCKIIQIWIILNV